MWYLQMSKTKDMQLPENKSKFSHCKLRNITKATLIGIFQMPANAAITAHQYALDTECTVYY